MSELQITLNQVEVAIAEHQSLVDGLLTTDIAASGKQPQAAIAADDAARAQNELACSNG